MFFKERTLLNSVVYYWYDSFMIGEVLPDHEKCHADHYSQHPGSGAL